MGGGGGGGGGGGRGAISLAARTLIDDRQGYFLVITSVKSSIRVLCAGQHP